MLRQHHLLAAALVTLGVLGACTQDFSQFDPAGDPATSSSTGTAGGAGGEGGGGTTTTTTTTTSSGGTGENCADGSDDDGDGAVDCADSECGAYSCVATPAGWEGPGILYDGPPDALPDCPEDFQVEAYNGVREAMPGNAACSACACDAPTVTCTAANLVGYGTNNCGNFQGSLNQNQAVGQCVQTQNNNVDSVRANVPTLDASACAPTGGELQAEPPQVATVGRVCTATPGGGCTDGVCAPAQIDAPFLGQVCVWQSGEQACPDPYTVQYVYGSELQDNRSCEACSCGDADATCTITTILYTDGNCQNQLVMVPNNNTCTQATGAGSVMVTKDMTGSCPPSGGNLTGEIELGPERTTVCCLP